MEDISHITLCGDSFMNNIPRTKQPRGWTNRNDPNDSKKAQFFNRYGVANKITKKMKENETKVVISLGGGDLKGDRTPDQIVADLVAIANDFKKANKKPFICKLNNLNENRWDSAEEVRVMNAKVTEINQKLGKAFEDCETIDIPQVLPLGEDGCHPNAKGYDIYLKTIAEHLKKNGN